MSRSSPLPPSPPPAVSDSQPPDCASAERHTTARHSRNHYRQAPLSATTTVPTESGVDPYSPLLPRRGGQEVPRNSNNNPHPQIIFTEPVPHQHIPTSPTVVEISVNTNLRRALACFEPLPPLSSVVGGDRCGRGAMTESFGDDRSPLPLAGASSQRPSRQTTVPPLSSLPSNIEATHAAETEARGPTYRFHPYLRGPPTATQSALELHSGGHNDSRFHHHHHHHHHHRQHRHQHPQSDTLVALDLVDANSSRPSDTRTSHYGSATDSRSHHRLDRLEASRVATDLPWHPGFAEATENQRQARPGEESHADEYGPRDSGPAMERQQQPRTHSGDEPRAVIVPPYFPSQSTPELSLTQRVLSPPRREPSGTAGSSTSTDNRYLRPIAPSPAVLPSTLHRHSSQDGLRSSEDSGPLARPINTFLRYRKEKMREMRSKNSKISQTEISKLTSLLWKKEPEEVKLKYKQQYQEEKDKIEQEHRQQFYQQQRIRQQQHQQRVCMGSSNVQAVGAGRDAYNPSCPGSEAQSPSQSPATPQGSDTHYHQQQQQQPPHYHSQPHDHRFYSRKHPDSQMRRLLPQQHQHQHHQQSPISPLTATSLRRVSSSYLTPLSTSASHSDRHRHPQGPSSPLSSSHSLRQPLTPQWPLQQQQQQQQSLQQPPASHLYSMHSPPPPWTAEPAETLSSLPLPSQTASSSLYSEQQRPHRHHYHHSTDPNSSPLHQSYRQYSHHRQGSFGHHQHDITSSPIASPVSYPHNHHNRAGEAYQLPQHQHHCSPNTRRNPDTPVDAAASASQLPSICTHSPGEIGNLAAVDTAATTTTTSAAITVDVTEFPPAQGASDDKKDISPQPASTKHPTASSSSPSPSRHRSSISFLID